MNLSVDDFGAFHSAIHGRAPFAWQTRLLAQVVSERAWPRVLDLPTGAGKTTCLDIALFALALDAQASLLERWCPRRIAMVVDRRVVVDQVAERGRKLRNALTQRSAPLVVSEVAQRLAALTTEGDQPLGVFTLRGGMPKDDAWARTPEQPLILASTVDQLGSRLLIQGYGVSKGMKPVHAGLLANDILILLDEVHLSQPFAETLDALASLRRRFAQMGSVPARFHHVFLSATPGRSASGSFRLEASERALESALGPRLHAVKPTSIDEVSGRSALEQACLDHACRLSTEHDVVAVVVNRVASASTLAHQLREKLVGKAEVALLTGRMRPLDRDDRLRALRPLIMTGRDRSAVKTKLVLVGTQCIEAGADFDFDALVTEAASLDALRQRFGRVDRLGTYQRAKGVVVHDKTEKDDPVYSKAIGATVAWLKGCLTKTVRFVDFGVLGLPLPEGDDLTSLLAPKAKAPVLLPAYLDLWMQTSPAPTQVPDVSLWLHGPESGPADVQVVWRVDLTDEALENARDGQNQSLPMEVVAAVRPSSLEAVSLPYAAARRFLAEQDTGDVRDVEGVRESERQGTAPAHGLALRWLGEQSEVISAADLRPGDTIVVPATRGGLREGCFEPRSREVVHDLAERAALFGRGQAVLRLHPAVLAQLGLYVATDDLDEARATLSTLADEALAWRKLWLARVGKGRATLTVDAEVPWSVLQGQRVPTKVLTALLDTQDTAESGVELTTDDDDSYYAGRAVSLAQHSGDVERFARDYASALGLAPGLVEDLALAGFLHDIGKAERRFQLMLHGGSEISLHKSKVLLAKSAMLPGAKAAQRLARKRSGYPDGARHEVQSVAMIEQHLDQVSGKAHDLELVLHLVASHHGHCRPFAPVVFDSDPVEVDFVEHSSSTFGSLNFGLTSSQHELHRLDAPLADRFWNLVQRYGWHELCWLEAILRLADHRASEAEQEGALG